MANALVELYVGFDDRGRLASGERASAWLSDRVRQLRADVQAKEAAAQQYRAQSGLLTTDGVSLTERQVADMQQSMMQARADLAEKEARYRVVLNLVQTHDSADTIADALDSQVIRDLRAREVDQARHQAELESTLGPLHPDVQTGRAELENIRSQIVREVGRVQASVRNEVDVSRARLQALEGNMTNLRSQLVTNNGALVHQNELDREATAARSVYESFLQRYHIISEQGELADKQVRVISAAQAPVHPSEPNALLVLAIALVVGLGAGVGAGLLTEAFDNRLTSAGETERRFGARVISSIPAVRPKALRLLSPTERHPSGYLVDKPFSSFAEGFRVIASAIRFAAGGHASKIVAITSSLPDEGKTTCALSLARLASMAGHSTILIDCDRRRHSLNELLDINPSSGLVDVLKGAVSWRDILSTDDLVGVHILASPPTSSGPRDIFNSDAVNQLFEELRQSYEFVILDCAPVLMVAETRDLASKADLVLVVGRAGKTPANAMGSTLDQLRRVEANVLGVVLNCVDPTGAGGDAYSSAFYYGEQGYFEG